jgi:hypothetical protein
VELASGPHDPLDELEVVAVRRAIYAQDESVARCAAAATVSADQFLTYHYGRQDDCLALDSAAH